MNIKPLPLLSALALAWALLAGCSTMSDTSRAHTRAPYEPTALIIADEHGPLSADELDLRRPAIINYLVNRGYMNSPDALVDNPAEASRFIRVILSADGGFRITEFTLGNRARQIVTSNHIPGHSDSSYSSRGYTHYSAYANQPYYYEPPVIYIPPPPYSPPHDQTHHPRHDYRPRDNDNRNHPPHPDRPDDARRHPPRSDDGREHPRRDHDPGNGRNWSDGPGRSTNPPPTPPPAPSYTPPPPRNDPPPAKHDNHRLDENRHRPNEP